MREILSVRPKCSHRCVSLKETFQNLCKSPSTQPKTQPSKRLWERNALNVSRFKPFWCISKYFDACSALSVLSLSSSLSTPQTLPLAFEITDLIAQPRIAMTDRKIQVTFFRYRPKGVFGKGVGNSQNASEMRQKCVRNASKWVLFYWETRNVKNVSEIRLLLRPVHAQHVLRAACLQNETALKILISKWKMVRKTTRNFPEKI